MKEKELTLEINKKEYKVTISEFTSEHAVVSVNGNKYTVGLKDLGLETAPLLKPVEVAAPAASPAAAPRKAAKSPVHRPKSIDDGKTINAPLPGMILKINVKEGDTVKAGQPVIMLEAMKMENEVNAASDGVVLDIKFNEGDSVNQGDVLMLLKPVEG